MGLKHLILAPGDSLARRFDEGHAGFIDRIRRGIKMGDCRLCFIGFGNPTKIN